MTTHTILLAGELGAGLGHIIPLNRIATALRDAARNRGDDVRCVYAVHDPELATSLKQEGDLVLQAPRTNVRSELKSHTASYAELLIANGFAKPDILSAGISTWDDIFTLVSPALLIADHSPKAVLAARGRIPTLVTGNGFTVPPATLDAFPSLMAGMEAPAIQGRLKENVNSLLVRRGGAPVERLPEFLKGDARAIFTLPQLDPYGRLRDTPLAGPYEDEVRAVALPSKDRIFIYGHTGVGSFCDLVRAVLETGLPISAFLTGDNHELSFLLRQRGAEVFETAPRLADILPRASLVVSNGGAGLTQAALTAGRPQVLHPLHVESQMTTRNLIRLGYARLVEETAPESIGSLLQEAAQDEKMKAACQSAAADIGATRPSNMLAGIAATCLTLLRR